MIKPLLSQTKRISNAWWIHIQRIRNNKSQVSAELIKEDNSRRQLKTQIEIKPTSSKKG